MALLIAEDRIDEARERRHADPVGRTTSMMLTDAGLRRSWALCQTLFTRPA